MIPPALIALQVGWSTILLTGGAVIPQNSTMTPEQIVKIAALAAVVTGIASLMHRRS